jgi:hypothetical protein
VPTDPPARKPASDSPTPAVIPPWRRLWEQVRGLDWSAAPRLGLALVVGLLGFVAYHAWLAVLDLRDPPQREPYFEARSGPGTGTESLPVEEDIQQALRASGGGYFEHLEPSVPGGRVALYHFFWKPAAANRWVTGHRPDICMPAGGWRKDGEPEPVEVIISGQRLLMHAFRFANDDVKALQLWGIWRNGEPVHMRFFDNPTLEWSLLTGKSRSAVEVLSCFVPYAGKEAPLQVARETVAKVFEYRRGAASDRVAGVTAPSGLTAQRR